MYIIKKKKFIRLAHKHINNTETHKRNGTHIHLHYPADTFKPCTMSGWANCQECTFI